MKETTELFQAIFRTANSVKLAAADKKLDKNDLQHIIPIIFGWQAAIEDLIFYQEATKATGALIDAMFATAAKELSAFSDDSKTAIVNLTKGVYSTYWVAVKAGSAAGKAEILAEIKAKGLPAVLAAHNA